MKKELTYSPFVPFDPDNFLYVQSEGMAVTPPGTGGVHPFEYTGWWDEMLSYYDNCYIHAGLNPMPAYTVSGKNSLVFFKKYFTNSFEKFPIGTGKHGIICNEEGKIVQDGVILRISEEDYLTYGLWPAIGYCLDNSGIEEVCGKNITGEVFMFQLAGPKSLKILQKATGEELTDIKFFHFRNSMISGKNITVLRIGMAGSLAYEVHGKRKDAIDVYNAILAAGEEHGIRRLGRHAYRNTHTEGGFPQQSIHYVTALPGEDFPMYMMPQVWTEHPFFFNGSLSDNISAYTRNPIELGWGKAVKFDHDFIGREALEKETANPSSKTVTLVWNKEDIIDVWSSMFENGEPYKLMDFCEDLAPYRGNGVISSDRVFKDGKEIGISSGRMFSPKRRQMISMGSIKPEFCETGEEVQIVWGEPGHRQKLIKAVISEWPYISKDRNENIDVTKL